MKKTLFFVLVLVVFVLSFTALATHAAKPSDFGLKEGDLISAIFSDDPDIYIINENGYKRLFLNPEIFKFYGHLGGFLNVKLVTPEVRDSFITSSLLRNCESSNEKVYGVDASDEDNGTLHWVNSSGSQAVADDPDFFKKVFCINNREFNWYPRGNELRTVKDVPKYERTNKMITATTQEKLASVSDDELKGIGQVTICHYPSGNRANHQTITVGTPAVKAHFKHGDTMGACDSVTPTPTPTPTPLICEYAAPPAGCSYVNGPNFNPVTLCGKILSCPTPTPTPTPAP
jgi:hypothetical protein